MILKQAGYNVVSVLTVADAVTSLEHETFQLVITDYFMGDGTGADVVRVTKNKQPATPIMIISGNCSEIPDWLKDGRVVRQIFAKPFALATLVSGVKAVLAAASVKGADPSPDFTMPATFLLPKGVEEMVHRVVDQESIIAITDKKGTIVYANDRFCEISGFNRFELIGQNHRLLKSGRHSTAFYKELWSTILSGRTWRGEVCNKSKDGRLYYVDTTIAPLREEGLITFFIAIRTDITARREAEIALVEQSRHEEENRRMASLGRMADGLVHDLNNILTGIMGITLEIGEVDRDKLLHEAISRMAQLTRTLRDYSTGRPTKPEAFRLNPLISCVCSLVRHRKGGPQFLSITEQINATVDIDVMGNEGQVFEVVLNLMVNALEASAASKLPLILVRSEVEDGRVVIRVEDNGPGLPEAMAAALFEPFASTKGKGRGIGLSASRSIAVAHGGELLLERAGGSGQGACFKLVLPARVLSTERPLAPPEVMANGTKRVVLVSEDEASVRRVIAQDAAQVGLTVMNAGDTADLLALAAQMKEVLAAAVIDSCEIDSDHGAVSCLRRLVPNLPIVLISGALPATGKRATPWGEVESLPKPFDSEALKQVLRMSTATARPAESR